MKHLELFLLGAPRLIYNGAPTEISLHKGLALLIYLAATRQAYTRDALATLLWPENDQSSARANLRRTLYRINQDIGDNVLVASLDRIEIDPEVGVELDVNRFQEHVNACLLHDGYAENLSPDCRERLAEAVKLYSQDFLTGFTLPDAPAFDEWQFFEAEGLRQALMKVLMQLIIAYRAGGEYNTAIHYARRLVSLDPLRESSHSLLIELYGLSGQQAAALRQFKELVRILKKELDLSPQPGTFELYEKIRHGIELPSSNNINIPFSPETRYALSGGVHIAYQVLGNGPIDLVFVSGFISHLEQIWEEPELARFFKQLTSFCRLILFDKRGIGLSDRVGYPPSLENTVQDILNVMEAAGSRRAILMGVSEGGPVSLLIAADYPEKVLGLTVYGSMAKWVKSSDYPWALTPEQHNKWLSLLTENWGKALDLEIFAPSRVGDKAFQQWWARLLRTASSPGEVKAVLESMRDIDVRSILPGIRIPVLILHRTGDRAIRVEGGRFLARQIPGARYIELPGEDHWWWIGDSDPILREIERFVNHISLKDAFLDVRNDA
jgi:DNA-binding SARP family transcriptional activator/alpha-beta hydrolase superfamily lysophospholipase